MSTTSLIVPINVAALAVGNPDVQNVAQNLAPMADFSQLPYVDHGTVHNRGPYLGAVALENAAPFSGQVSLPPGIHLHWALPDGLTAGTADATGLAFPSAPNRWLVTRIVVAAPSGAAATTALKSWVIESDRLTSTATAPAGLSQPTVLGADQFTSYYLGQAFDLATWSEDAAASRLTPFTALGYGHPTFASFYPNSSTVFGYYDGLTDLTDYDSAVSTISYQVCGWYSSVTDDPLAQPGATPATYGWRVANNATPTATLCSGVLGGINWDPTTEYLQVAPQPLTVAIGPSAPEALSALMADVVKQKNSEQILNALQFGLLSGSTNQINALAAFEEAVHAAGFAALTGSTLWTVTRAKADEADGGKEPLPDNLSEPLNALNVSQLQLDAVARTIEALQFNLFTSWYKYQLVEYNAPKIPSALQSQVTKVKSYVQNAVMAIEDAQQQALALQVEVTNQAKALAKLLPSRLVLTNDLGAPRYYQPSAPVLILSGPDVTPTRRYGYDAANGPLPCRTEADLLTAVTLAAGLVAGSDSVTLAAGALPRLVAQPTALAQALLADAFLLAASLQAAVAAAVEAQGGANNPAALNRAATVSALVAASEALLAGQAPVDVSFVGSAPAALYYDAWAGTPWLPMLLQYDVQFAPVQFLAPDAAGSSPTYAPEFINDNFTFTTDGIDLQYSGTLPTQTQSYQGTAILTPDATVDLANEITQFINNTGPDAELSCLLNDLQNLPILAQGLTGLTEALLMRDATLQLPVADPLAALPQQGFIADVKAAVATQNQVAPLPENSFNPIRSGVLTISQLRLIDVFGRFQDYATPKVLTAKSLAFPGMPDGAAFLPPRLSQPSRLLFRWRAANDSNVETNDSPATSPVLGWVVPNYLDNSLLLYAPDGTPLGELALFADQETKEKKVRFIPAPGGAYQPGTVINTVFQNQAPDFAHFAVGLYNEGDGEFFELFFQAVREGLTFALPQQFAENAQQAVLAGQPLALARARLTLELAGQAATDESWAGFTNAVLNDEAPSDAGIGQVKFPVVLGASDQLDDTLVGYWIRPTDSEAYRTFYTAYAPKSQGGVVIPSQSTLVVSTQGEDSEKDVVLLLDPRGSVHATTGVLPVKVIDIPPVQFTSALAKLELTFSVTPVLSGSNLPAAASAGAGRPMTLVRPKVGTGTWSWLTTDGTAWTTTTLTTAATAQATLNYTPQHISEGWLGLRNVTTDFEATN